MWPEVGVARVSGKWGALAGAKAAAARRIAERKNGRRDNGSGIELLKQGGPRVQRNVARPAQWRQRSFVQPAEI